MPTSSSVCYHLPENFSIPTVHNYNEKYYNVCKYCKVNTCPKRTVILKERHSALALDITIFSQGLLGKQLDLKDLSEPNNINFVNHHFFGKHN